MKANNTAHSDQRPHFTVAICLLLIQPLALARSDQVHKALMQAEASLRSLDQGDTQGAAAHAEAAQSHVDIALRDTTGESLQRLKGCKTKLQETQQEANKDRISKAKASAIKARDDLKKLADN
jgi:hypothetical protein